MQHTSISPPGYRHRVRIFGQDDFTSGNATSGSVGQLGWIATGGTTSVVAGESNRFGILRRDTTTTQNTIAQLLLGFTSSNFDPAEPFSVIFEVRLNQNDANTAYRVGLANAFSTNPPTHGIYFEKLDADSNVFCVTRAATVQTGSRTDSGVAVSTGWVRYQIIRHAAGVDFYINDVLVATQTANIPTTFLNLGGHIVNASAAAAKTLDYDYSEFDIAIAR
jgi:hypothetical protein